MSRPRVLVVGAGGLGCPAAWVLARSGLCDLTLLDDDVVSLSNLHRQLLYTDADVGESKARVARERLARLAPDLDIRAETRRLTAENAAELIGAHDLVLDGTDDVASKLLCSDIAVRRDVPLLHAGVLRFQGVVWPILRGGPCLRCLFEDGPEDAPTCAEAATCAVSGAMKRLTSMPASFMCCRVSRNAATWPATSRPPSVVTSCRRSGTRQTMSGWRRSAMAMISGALASSRFKRVQISARSRKTSRS